MCVAQPSDHSIGIYISLDFPVLLRCFSFPIALITFRRKSKFRGNQYTAPKKSITEMTSSASKLRDSPYDVGTLASSSSSSMEGYRVIDVGVLAEFLVANLVRKKCYSKATLSELEDERMGLASKLTLKCQTCQNEGQSYTSKKLSYGAFDVTIQMVLSMRMIGCLLDPLQRFCSSMNMPSYMGDATYKSDVTSLLKAATEAAEGA